MISANHVYFPNTPLSVVFGEDTSRRPENWFLKTLKTMMWALANPQCGTTGNFTVSGIDTLFSRPREAPQMTQRALNPRREDGPLHLPGPMHPWIWEPGAGKNLVLIRVMWCRVSSLLSKSLAEAGLYPAFPYRQHIHNSSLLQGNGYKPLCSVVCGVYHVSRTRARVGALRIQRSIGFYPSRFSPGLELPPDGTRISEPVYFECSVNASTRTRQMPLLSSQPPDISASRPALPDFSRKTQHFSLIENDCQTPTS